MQPAVDLDFAFAALADPTRRAILARLAQGEATVLELAEPFEMTQPAVSQHLKVLEQAGLIVQRVDGARRPRRLSSSGLNAVDQWLRNLQKGLTASYNRLDGVLASMQQKTTPPPETAPRKTALQYETASQHKAASQYKTKVQKKKGRIR